MRSPDRLLWIVAAAPVAVGLFALSLGLGTPAAAWFWPEPATNIAEAAALGDAARMRALAAQGAAVDAALPLRPGLLEGNPPAMSALEAAIQRGEYAVVEVALELWDNPAHQDAVRLYCAAAIRSREIAELLRVRFDLGLGVCR